MKVAERDELIIRTHEQTLNIWRVVDRMEQHQADQNDHILTALTLSKGNRTWITVFKWAGGTMILSGIGFAGWIIERLI